MTPAAFRSDIQGLRAIAVLLVLVYHLWPDTLPGGFVGVDVFFVISGFLITGQLLHRPPEGWRDLLEFWGRRIRRILPAAFLVLGVTAVASRILAPETRWAAIAGETIASALYVQNWALAGSAVDYLAAEEAPTPLQHYWSLSVEEQFYLVWPILILVAFWLARRSRLPSRAIVLSAMLSVVGVSLAWSLVATASEPASAYFITPTRVWELAVGGCIAMVPAVASPARAGRARDGAAWLGISMILAAAFVITAGMPFPGSAALLPVAGAALVILAAAEGRTSPTRLLGLRPIQHVGDTSYSIYLWHWPLIALWPFAVGEITLLGAVAIVGATVGLASVSKVHVEDRIRFAPSLQPLAPTFRFAVVGMLAVSLLGSAQLVEAQLRLDAATASASSEAEGPMDGSAAQLGIVADEGLDEAFEDVSSDVTPQAEIGPAATASGVVTAPAATASGVATAAPSVTPDATARLRSCRGAASIVRGFSVCPQDPRARMVPDPLAARSDWSDAYRDGCWIYTPFSDRTACRYGRGKVRIALVGNSHAGQWLPTLQVLAKRNGWSITTYLASRCNATDAVLELYGGAAGCLDFGRWVARQTRGDAFDLVVTSERQSVKTRGAGGWPETRKAAVAGYTSYLRRWSDAGTSVLILRDTPFPGRTLDTVPDCLASHRTRQTACAGTPDTWRWMDPLYEAAASLDLPGITAVDTTRFLCTESTCPAVIGGVVAYFDSSHMTATYARSIAPFIEAEILAVLDARRAS